MSSEFTRSAPNPLAPPNPLDRLSELRATGEAADGLVSVELDGTGAVQELTIEPKAMRLASADLAAALTEALAIAHASVRERLADLTSSLTPSPADVDATLQEITVDARVRLQEMTSLAHHVADRLERWP